MSRFQKYLSTEIGIEYKACLYFFAIAFFYCMYQVLQGRYEAPILYLAEMIFFTYIMGYVQVYLLRNFDESEQFGGFEAIASVGCTVIYMAASYFLGWFDKKIGVTVFFACYVLFMYICMFLVNKVKRDIDTKILNDELEQFKKSRGEKL